MSNTTNLSIRMDKRLKEEADTLYSELGMNLTTAITIFVKQSVRQRRIPFEISLDNDSARFASRASAVSAVERIRENAEQNGTAKLTMDEINTEIMQARAERRARGARV